VASAGVIAGGVISTGGFTALIAKVLRKKKDERKQSEREGVRS
jgi:uncharacterized protein YoaH (UPF0181 family)